MRTAQEYYENIDKEAVIGMAALVGKGAKFTVKAPKPTVKPSFGDKLKGGYDSAKKWTNTQYGNYKKTDFGKKYGKKPIYAAGGAGAFMAGRSTGGSDVNIRI